MGDSIATQPKKKVVQYRFNVSTLESERNKISAEIGVLLRDNEQMKEKIRLNNERLKVLYRRQAEISSGNGEEEVIGHDKGILGE